MTKVEAARNAAIKRIGCPYVYGGTGKTCTPSYREARAAQYPKYADLIRENCPRMRGSATSCVNCKWADPSTGKGKPCYDCERLSLVAMAAAGIPLVSGANSQWLKTQFTEKGEIAAMPKDKTCLVFRRDSDGRMHHVGVYMGDGTVIHAKGHAYGVVREKLDEMKKPMTHYGIPVGLYDNGYPTVRKGNSGEYVRIMQEALKKAGEQLKVDGIFGKGTQECVIDFQSKNGLAADGVCGPKTWKALEPYIEVIPVEPSEPDENDEPEEDEPVEVPDGIYLDNVLTEIAAIQMIVQNALSRLDTLYTELSGLSDREGA